MTFTVDEVVGANVRTLRELAGISQADLAARLTVLGTDWTASNVSLIEAGKRKLTLTALGDLCRVFGVPTPALFGTHDADGATAMRLTAMGGTDTATLTATPAVAVDQDAAAIVILRLAERRAVRRARRTMEGAP